MGDVVPIPMDRYEVVDEKKGTMVNYGWKRRRFWRNR